MRFSGFSLISQGSSSSSFPSLLSFSLPAHPFLLGTALTPTPKASSGLGLVLGKSYGRVRFFWGLGQRLSGP